MKEQKWISVEEIPKKFKGLRPMNEEEKERYIEYAHLVNRTKISCVIGSILFYSIAILGMIGILLNLIDRFSMKSLLLALLVTVVLIGLLFIGRIFQKESVADKKLIQKIRNEVVLTGNCYLVEKNCSSAGVEYAISYLVKVSDKNVCIDKWISISGKLFKNIEKEDLKLVVLEKNPKDLLDVIPRNV